MEKQIKRAIKTVFKKRTAVAENPNGILNEKMRLHVPLASRKKRKRATRQNAARNSSLAMLVNGVSIIFMSRGW